MHARRSNLAQGFKDGTNETDDRKKSPMASIGTPMLAAGQERQRSYGSCDNTRADAQGDPLNNHTKRHKIGSEVLDFGEPSDIWQGNTTQKLSKKSSQKKGSSALPIPDLSHILQSSAEHTSKQGSVISFSRDINEQATNSITQVSSVSNARLPKRSDTLKKVKSVFSLFGLDGVTPQDQDLPGTELSILVNQTGRPRANATASRQLPFGSNIRSQSCACPKLNLESEATKSRAVSWSRYLDEISRIGANGVSDVSLMNMPSGKLNDFGAGSRAALPRKVSKTRRSSKVEVDPQTHRQIDVSLKDIANVDCTIELPIKDNRVVMVDLVETKGPDDCDATNRTADDEASNIGAKSPGPGPQVNIPKKQHNSQARTLRSSTTPLSKTRKLSTNSRPPTTFGTIPRKTKKPADSEAWKVEESSPIVRPCQRGKGVHYRGRNVKRGRSSVRAYKI